MTIGLKFNPVLCTIPANPELCKRIDDFLKSSSYESLETIREELDSYILHYEKLAFEEAERTLKEYELANSIRIEEEIDKDLLIAIVKLNRFMKQHLLDS